MIVEAPIYAHWCLCFPMASSSGQALCPATCPSRASTPLCIPTIYVHCTYHIMHTPCAHMSLHLPIVAHPHDCTHLPMDQPTLSTIAYANWAYLLGHMALQHCCPLYTYAPRPLEPQVWPLQLTIDMLR